MSKKNKCRAGPIGLPCLNIFNGDDVEERILFWIDLGDEKVSRLITESSFLLMLASERGDDYLYTREMRHWVYDNAYNNPAFPFKDSLWSW